MLKRRSHLGIVDWGIGGFGIYNLIKLQLGDIPVTYFSDTGVPPYGKLSRRELVSRLNLLIPYLSGLGVTHLVVGCNAASTVLSSLNTGEIKVAGVIENAIRATARMDPTRLALIGGRRTVLSGVYRRGFAEQGIAVRQRIGQPLSAHIEAGDVSSPALRRQCADILAPLRNHSHVLLACTHYPAIWSILKDCVSRDTVFIDPAFEVVSQVRKWRMETGGPDTFLTSGEPEKMRIAASNAFGTQIRTIERVPICQQETP